ncbi:cysteine--tRNA ligase [Salisediminibacterium halotolerans]|uniref:cysteine--tRNA ligase n=1 Tax=Salisediminibacterium halotolerans TaxID=517425 RepID=UPI000EB2EFA2|nr:cysteine--tRNA ligase [Salisediminibacterium halotolerans]RLJ73055.1 cysteinyl-tRNA synthetase [Actinophytocola xinjiangensis]RPE86477.1 cysteinyl-tRNA synthetase [Salisediminibacterium halotolerans]TWG33852.1 cysteinyl-tRNA synthetase [Salisediminibacterium halotolerans]GEL08364.1 cysteine--tRNA ligase [Salisediminibacterium halotolerans]
MTIQLYNTLTRQKERFEPIEEGKVKMYVCGPTVYNYIHIGNARPAVVFDMVRRYLEYRGYDVHYVSNFTDVDDKIIKSAEELDQDVMAVAERFIDAYYEDTEALGVKKADEHPRVTDTMPEIIAFIERLVAKGYAYESDGDVYFRTRKFENYGQLSHQSIDDLQAGARIQVGEKKEDPLDFVLWKKAKDNEIAWESPWGNGRPGWHIECSAMVKKHLGETIDIHAGGQDLSFPHHENEIAQSEALNEKKMANYWIHNGYINIDNEKMSKSLDNFILVHDIIKQYDPEIVRFFIVNAHYRSPINFSDEQLNAAGKALERIRTTYQNTAHRLAESADLGSDADSWKEKIISHRERFIEAMDDDFNSANAVAVMFDLVKTANLYLEEKQTAKSVLQSFLDEFDDMAFVLGIKVKEEEELLDEEIEQLIEERVEARKNRHFQRADEIRDLLKEKGIVLEDTPQGTRWKRGDV